MFDLYIVECHSVYLSGQYCESTICCISYVGKIKVYDLIWFILICHHGANIVFSLLYYWFSLICHHAAYIVLICYITDSFWSVIMLHTLCLVCYITDLVWSVIILHTLCLICYITDTLWSVIMLHTLCLICYITDSLWSYLLQFYPKWLPSYPVPFYLKSNHYIWK